MADQCPVCSHLSPCSGGSYGGGGGGSSFGGPIRKETKQDIQARKNQPFNDISKIPNDPESTVPETVAWRKENELTVAGGVDEPFLRYDQVPGLPPALMQGFTTAGYTIPSVIQAQAWPAAMQNRDVIGVAKTGSGKTLGFLAPAFKFITDRTWGHLDPRRGPCVLVLAPTRELANQIHEECVKFGRALGIQATCVYGGAPKGPQMRDVRNGVHIIIATPGRLNDFLESRQINLEQVKYLVFDEADRMLDMGFEPQIRTILKYIPGQRQTLFFTATWPKVCSSSHSCRRSRWAGLLLPHPPTHANTFTVSFSPAFAS